MAGSGAKAGDQVVRYRGADFAAGNTTSAAFTLDDALESFPGGVFVG